MTKPDYKKLIPFLIKWEGGYVNDPLDRGGETNRGITWKTFYSLSNKVLGVPASKERFIALNKHEAGLFIKHFWDKATYNNSINNQAVAEVLTTWNWGSGYYGLKEYQRMLNEEFNQNLVIDGNIGPATVKASNSINPKKIYAKALEWRKAFFEKLAQRDPSQQRFLKGWLNRLAEFSARHSIAVGVSVGSFVFFATAILIILKAQEE